MDQKYVVNFLKDIRVGALTASSRYTVRRTLTYLKPEHRYIVEYGAGNGVMTKPLLELLPVTGRFVAFETNSDLLTELTTIQDSRLTVVNRDITTESARLHDYGLPRIDAVISGVPLTFFSPKVRETIVANTRKHLASHGVFIVYQYSPLILPLLKKYFDRVDISYEIRNFMPYFIMAAHVR